MNHIKAYIKILCIYFLRSFMRLLYIVPIKENRVILNSYRGQQYTCNPKYITEYLIAEHPGEFEIYWAFNHPEDYGCLTSKGIKLVKYNSLKRFYIEATAKFSINNIGSFSWLPQRKGQEHINTWHGSVDYKRCALGETANDSIMKKTLILSAKETTVFFSANHFSSKVCIPNDFGYTGFVFEKGVPRNDIFFNKKIHRELNQRIRAFYGVDEETTIVLYAPTWRYGACSKVPDLDLACLQNELSKKFGKAIIFCRSHHITGQVKWSTDSVIDVSGYKDAQELMVACDMLITDYSSMIWDYSLLLRPIILYTPDVEQYQAERGFNLDILEWGFPVCKTQSELTNCIADYNPEKASALAKAHHEKLGSFETGCAAESFYEWMSSVLHSA